MIPGEVPTVVGAMIPGEVQIMRGGWAEPHNLRDAQGSQIDLRTQRICGARELDEHDASSPIKRASMARLLSGSIFIENSFGYRGFGWVAIGAFRGGDIQTVAASTLVSAFIVMIANLVVDMLYGVLDPRVRLGNR